MAISKGPTKTQNPKAFYQLAKENGGLTKTHHVSKEFIRDAAAGKYGKDAKEMADRGIKKSGQTEKYEEEASLQREKDKAERERKKANTILSRSQRARGGGSYEANPISTKLG